MLFLLCIICFWLKPRSADAICFKSSLWLTQYLSDLPIGRCRIVSLLLLAVTNFIGQNFLPSLSEILNLYFFRHVNNLICSTLLGVFLTKSPHWLKYPCVFIIHIGKRLTYTIFAFLKGTVSRELGWVLLCIHHKI